MRKYVGNRFMCDCVHDCGERRKCKTSKCTLTAASATSRTFGELEGGDKYTKCTSKSHQIDQ